MSPHVTPLIVLFGSEQSGPEAAGLRRGSALPEPLDRQPVPTRHQREPVRSTPQQGPRPPKAYLVAAMRHDAVHVWAVGSPCLSLPEHG